MLNSFQTLKPDSDAPTLHANGDKPSVSGFLFMEQEIWVKLSESDEYEVSNLCRVRSLKGEGTHFLKVFISKTGYYVVNLFLNGQRRSRKLHRLFAIAFLPNPNNYPSLNHRDGNKLNNSIGNLQWATQKMNIHHAFRTGLVGKVFGQKQSSTKLSDELVLEIYASPLTKAELSRKHNIPFSTVAAVKSGLSWSWLTGAPNKRKYKKYDSDIIGD